MSASAPLVLGLDPGLQATGWGLISSGSSGGSLRCLGSGTLRPPPRLATAARLKFLHDGLQALLAQWQPQAAAIEESFVGRHAHAALKLGQARAICQLALAQRGLAIGEYAPTRIKQALCGYGRADKAQIRGMLKWLLPDAAPKSEHAADALAVAVCHAHHQAAPQARRAAAEGLAS